MPDTISIVGAGVMGSAVVRGLIAGGVAPADQIVIHEIDADRRAAIVTDHGVRPGDALPGGVRGARVVVLAIKPQAFEAATAGLDGALGPDQLVLSIMAGVRLQTLCDRLGSTRVIRVMPNMPAQVGRGVSVWMGGPGVETGDRELAVRMLGALGTQVEVTDERAIDAATAVHGSGPAYVFLVAEAMLEAARTVGLAPEVAETLVRETLAGSVELWAASGEAPAVLREAVTSPGGTTEAALRVFEAADFRGIFRRAVEAAYRRSQELG